MFFSILIHKVNDALTDFCISGISLPWNSLKSSHIQDLSGAPGVGQKVSPFSRGRFHQQT